MAKVKELGKLFYKIKGWKAGDKVVCVKSVYHKYVVGEVYTLEDSSDSATLFLKRVGCNGIDGEFELVKEEVQWSDWEEVVYQCDHSKYNPGCLVQQEWKDGEGKLPKTRVSLPKRVPLKELSGSVEVDKDNNPIFSTYQKD